MPLPFPMPPPRPYGRGPAEMVLDRFQKTHGDPIEFKNPRIEQRLTLIDLRSPLRRLEVPANPETMRYRHETVWKRAQIEGASFEPMQPSHTKNPVIEFSLFLDARRMQDENHLGVDRVAQAMRFLDSMTVPENPAEHVIELQPIMRIEWPQFLTMNVVILSLDFDILYWTADSFPLPRIVRVDLSLEEKRDTAAYARDVMTWGMERTRVGTEAKLPQGIVLGQMAARRRRR